MSVVKEGIAVGKFLFFVASQNYTVLYCTVIGGVIGALILTCSAVAFQLRFADRTDLLRRLPMQDSGLMPPDFDNKKR
jgi:hypothetical protein